MRSRWQWTHTYGVHLLVASIAAVVLSGSGLLAVVALTGDPDDPPPNPPTGSPTDPPPHPPPSPPPAPSPSVTQVATDECVVGSWRALELVDVGYTGTWTLVAGGPTFEYREDGTGVIDYGGQDQSEHNTTFEFKDDLFGETSNSTPTGRREFRYVLESGAIHHSYQDPFGGAEMHRVPYNPTEDVFAYQCSGDSMTLEGERGSVTLQRQ